MIKTLTPASVVVFTASLGAAFAEGKLNLICSGDVVTCEFLSARFTEDTGVAVNMVQLSTGEALAKLRSEAANPKTDIWWGGTGDPHLQAAEAGLTAEYKSEKLPELQDWAQKQAEISGYRTVGVYAGPLGWALNTDIAARKNLPEPKCWSDLIRPEYKGEVQIANPNSSGTAYTVLASLAQIMGEDAAFDYLAKLNANVSQYTKSGSAPAKAAGRGETGLGVAFVQDAVMVKVAGFPVKAYTPCEGAGYEVGSMSIVAGARNIDAAKTWYDWALTPETQSLLSDPQYNFFQNPSNKAAKSADAAVRMEDVKLIDYDFETYGSAEMRQHLIERWNNEIGSLSK